MKARIVIGAMVFVGSIGIFAVMFCSVGPDMVKSKSNEAVLGHGYAELPPPCTTEGCEVTVSLDGLVSHENTTTTESNPMTDVASRSAEEEDAEGTLVNGFDRLIDKWMKPSVKGVTMTDVDHFVQSFRKVPKARQDECIHRALNLIPDRNVILLAGVLMDKTMDKKIVKTVYQDILNRNEEVKKPILQEIFKDETHPCWDDTAWILDVTGEQPSKK